MTRLKGKSRSCYSLAHRLHIGYGQQSMRSTDSSADQWDESIPRTVRGLSLLDTIDLEETAEGTISSAQSPSQGGYTTSNPSGAGRSCLNQGYRRGRQDNEDDYDGEDGLGVYPYMPRDQAIKETKRNHFACPFHKRDPSKYGSWRDCGHPHSSIASVKQATTSKQPLSRVF
ncbi:uncharacterized protein JN550_002233 [Neoarthrinium moseri]|uniref:uncharacterized protein n=1 Tax=Neoarthrinium moseri TaxID=1658444 RepID=UPI001FDC6E16|nr:uncharacterized protein JN550_002233 [Neoarthrinium moseri]KAI1874804.1 hypothetical protein JN550_002233 [Neoarthrinium moseri]